LWIRWWTFEFHTTCGISRLAQDMLASHEEHCSMKFVVSFVGSDIDKICYVQAGGHPVSHYYCDTPNMIPGYKEGWLRSPNWTLNSYALQQRVSPGYMQHPSPEDVIFTKALFCACLFTPLTNLRPLYFTPSHIFGLTLCGLRISNEVFLCALEKLWNATISFGMPVCLFVRPSVVRPPAHTEELGSHWTDIYEILSFSIFRKPAQKIQG